MSNDPAAMLAIFLSIDPKVIARDLQEAQGQLRRVVDTISSLRAVHYKSRSPEIEAKISHFMMVQAHELASMPHIESEFKVFYVGFGAGEIVQNAEEAAFNKGKLAELSRKMAEIRKREGLSDGEYWYRHKGPADYQALEMESDDIAEKVTDTIFVHVLRRYSLNDQADLYEKDRAQFDILREIGGRVLMGNIGPGDEAQKILDAHIAQKHGQSVLDMIRKRARELRQLRGLKQ